MNQIPFINIDKIVQEKYYYCGQACMKMFDSSLENTQNELWEVNQKIP